MVTDEAEGMGGMDEGTTEEGKVKTTHRALLIKFDPGFLARIEHERECHFLKTRRRIARTAIIRSLIKDAMDARCQRRGELPPTATPVNTARGL